MIFDSENFTSIQENALISLIKRDDLQMEEIKIWKRVIEWGITRNPGLPSDPNTWTSENFLAIKTTLQNCLPLIRYFQIPGDDVIDNLQPYQQILDKNLWDDLIKRLVSPNRPILSVILPPRKVLIQTLPPRGTEQFSKVINEAHAAEIASWVDLKDNMYSVASNPYEFKLLLRGTRDGFTSDSFWDLCYKQENVVIVIKVKGTDEILGGYNPVGWDYPVRWGKPTNSLLHYKDCYRSFIFSLKNGAIQNTIVSRVRTQKNAIHCHFNRVPSFGEYGEDLSMYDETWECGITSYANPIRSVNGKFSAEEYEVFQISQKP
ncbi:hypothetical protein C2G38_2256877 [Gigaspora rosea]|nr:hypothetical protein C2G38_2256877 [Gigaspora rosea]